MPYRIRRRSFLQGAGAAAIGLGHWLRNSEAFAQGMTSPKRLLVIHHPVGTIKSNWSCQGTETDFTLSRILAPFEPVKSHMVVLDGMDIVAGGQGGGHEQGTVVMTTGVRTVELYPGNGGDDPKAEAPSFDQVFLNTSPSLQGTPIASLQVSCDDRVDVGEVSTRRLSYSARHTPMDPYLQPHLTYERVFGSLMPGGGSDAMSALRRARMLRKSVLDFNLSDLARMRTLAPSSEHERLDAHEDAVRELEVELDQDPTDPMSCGLTMSPPMIEPFLDGEGNRIGNGSYSTTTSNSRDDETHATIGQNHFAVIRAAFRCDMTRVVTFQWSPGTNHVSFLGQYPGQPSAIKMHHPLSHDFNDPNAPEFLTNVDTWYSERTSELLQSLLETDDLTGGKLLDNTLIPYVTEVAQANHSWNDAPFVVFGGPGVKLVGNRMKKYSPRRPLNDMWLACAAALDAPDFTENSDYQYERFTGPLDILE